VGDLSTRLEQVWQLLTARVQFGERQPHVVEMRCPTHDHVVATEATPPVWSDDDLTAYRCDQCLKAHVFRWGSPKPEYVRDEVRRRN
jgi:hypothetical protein